MLDYETTITQMKETTRRHKKALALYNNTGRSM